MDWLNEPWVKLYTRETPEDFLLSWQARFVWNELLKKVNRTGRLTLGRAGLKGLVAVLRIPAEIVAAGVNDLLEEGRLVQEPNGVLWIRNFEEAQESRKSCAQRKREQRARDRESSERKSESEPATVVNATNVSQHVTRGHTPSDLISLSSFQISSPEEVARTKPPPPPRPPEPPAPPLPRFVPSLPSEDARVLVAHQDAAERLWLRQEALRAEVCGELGLKPAPVPATPGRLLRVAQCLAAGTSEEECERALESCAREAREKRTMGWFNGVTNWNERNLTRALSQPAGRPRPKNEARVIEYVPAPRKPPDPELLARMQAYAEQLA